MSSYAGPRPEGSSSTSSRVTGDLNALIRQLQQSVGNRGPLLQQRQEEIETNRSVREDYSKESAFTDAQALMAQQLQESMQASLSGLTRAMEGAGASGSSLRALMTQQAAQEAAQRAAALGAQQAVSYGGISNDTSQILELLTRPDDAALQALVAAVAEKQRAVNTTPVARSSSRPTTAQAPVSMQQPGLRPAPAKPAFSVNATYEPWPKSQTSASVGRSPQNTMVSYGPTATADQLASAYTNILNTSPINSQENTRSLLNSTGFPVPGAQLRF
jgi:hypothetical protein